MYSAQLLAAIASQPNKPLPLSIFTPTTLSDVSVAVDVGKIFAEHALLLDKKGSQNNLQARKSFWETSFLRVA